MNRALVLCALASTACPPHFDEPFCSLLEPMKRPEVVIDEAGITILWDPPVDSLDVRDSNNALIFENYCEYDDAPCDKGSLLLRESQLLEPLVSGETYKVEAGRLCVSSGNALAEVFESTHFIAP